MTIRFFKTVIFAALFSFGATLPIYAANSLIVGTLVSQPPDDPTAVNKVRLEQGLKGIRVRMRWTNDFGVDQAGGFPIGITGAAVTLTVNGTPNTCVVNQPTPDAGVCGFISAPFDPFDSVHTDVDTVVIYYNATFPPSATVQVAVSGVTAHDGTVEDPSNNLIRFTTGTTPARTPASLELVYDISGSMSSPVATPDAANPSPKARIDALKDAADELYLLLSHDAMLGDRIGQLFFGSNVTGTGALVPAHIPTNVEGLETDLASKSPTDSTAMGKGLTSGAMALSSDSNARKFLFLFSDGEQNVDPMIVSPVATGGPISVVGGFNVPSTIKVCTITMGVQTAPGYALQEGMAFGCPSQHSLFVNADQPTFAQANLDTYFVKSLNDVLLGDKLEIVKDISATLSSTGTDSQTFLANTKDHSMSILLSWDHAGRQRPQLKLTAPDGTVVDLDGKTTARSDKALIHLNFPLLQQTTTIAPKGLWHLDISFNVSTGSASTNSTGLPTYHLLVVNDNETIATDETIDAQDLGVGDPIPLKVTVMDGGVPVTGATVSGILVGPDNGLGDILAKANNPSGSPAPNGDLVGSAANGKLELLLQDPAFQALLKSHQVPLAVLTDPGNTGTYTGQYTNALKEGHYQFLINIRGTSATNGDFERASELTVFERSKPDPSNTGLTLISSVIQPGGQVLLHLRVTPKDRFGAFIGPDYLPHLDITCVPCTVSIPIADDLRGSYDVTYQVASAATNPTIGLNVLGQTVTSVSLNSLTNPGGKLVASGQIGATVPHSNLGGDSASISLGAALEYRFTPMFSAEGYFGYDRFSASTGNDFRFLDLSGRFRLTFGTSTWRPFAYAGVGGYFGSAGGNHAGINTGGGLQYWFPSIPKLGVEASYGFNTVFTSLGGDPTYSTFQLGVRYVIK